MIRALLKRDQDQISRIHQEFYSSEFELDKLKNLTCGFAAVDENDRVICAGGIKSMIEMLIVTDKNIDLAKRQLALYDMLQTAARSTHDAGYRELHAFISDERWARYLIKHVGFKPIVGTGLVIGV